MKYIQHILLILLLFISSSVLAQDIPEPMKPFRMVNDFAGVFTEQEQNDLEAILRNYDDSTSTQIYVVTVRELNGYAASDYATSLGNKWKIGQKDKDNGAIILIKPKVGNKRGDVFIAVGYGLEPILTDSRIGRILDDIMVPHLKEDDYYGGTEATVLSMIDMLAGQFDQDGKAPAQSTTIVILTYILGGIFALGFLALVSIPVLGTMAFLISSFKSIYQFIRKGFLFVIRKINPNYKKAEYSTNPKESYYKMAKPIEPIVEEVIDTPTTTSVNSVSPINVSTSSTTSSEVEPATRSSASIDFSTSSKPTTSSTVSSKPKPASSTSSQRSKGSSGGGGGRFGGGGAGRSW